MNKVIEYVISAKDKTGVAVNAAKSKIASFAKSAGSHLMNIKAGLDMAMGAVRTFGDAFSETAKGGIGRLSDALKRLIEDGTISAWAQSLAESLTRVKDGAMAVLGPLMKVVSIGWKLTKATTEGVAQGIGGFVGALAGGGSLGDAFSAAGDGWNQGFNDVFDIDGTKAAQRERRGKAARDKLMAKEGAKKNAATPSKSLSDMLGVGASGYRKEIAIEIEQAKAKVEELEEIFKFDPTDDIALARLQLAEEYAQALEECTSKEEKEELDSLAKIAKSKIDTEEKLRKMEEQARKKQEAEEEKDRKDLEKRIADERKRLQTQLQADLEAAQNEYDFAQNALVEAQAKVQQAWGWYRDKDSLKAQIEEEKADAAAQKQFEKEFERLRSRRSDWRTAQNLSLDDEAVRRVGLAREQEKAAEEYVRQTAENTALAAEALQNIQMAIQEGGEE